MLSDEERMAIEHLKKYPINWLIENVNESAIKIVLNLIEKQSKEIEILNKNMNLLREQNISYKQSIHGLKEMNKIINKKWEDKIKAKIEEVHYKMIGHQDLREAVKQALNSLLEKE